MSQTLNYRGAAGMDDTEAFNARTTIRWKGDMLFRIFFYNDRLFFIKVGGSKQNQAAIHFGLIGAIVNHFAQKRAARKTQEKIASIAGIAPSTLLGQDKVNSAIEVSQITEPTLNPKSFWSSTPYGSFTFRDEKGKKKVFKFDEGPQFRVAEQKLAEVFGDRLVVKARWDDVKGKVVKVESARL